MAARSVHGAALAAVVLAVCWQAAGAGEGGERDADIHAGRTAIAAMTRGSHKTALRIFREALSSPCPEGSSSAGSESLPATREPALEQSTTSIKDLASCCLLQELI